MHEVAASKCVCLISAIDRNYVIPYAAMLTSVATKSSGVDLRAEVMGSELTDDDQAFLRSVAEGQGVALRLVKLPLSPFRFFRVRTRRGPGLSPMTAVSYAKAFADRYVEAPDGAVTVLIDADIAFRSSIAPIFDIALTRPVAATWQYARHRYDFNSGFAIVDLPRWRKIGVARIAEAFLWQYSDVLHSHDQQVLNLIFRDDWQEIDLAWNYIDEHYALIDVATRYPRDVILKTREDPIVVHYCNEKPWREVSGSRWGFLYQESVKPLSPLIERYNLVIPA